MATYPPTLSTPDALELTALSLEALSLSPSLPLPPLTTTLPSRPHTVLESLPLNIPSPPSLPPPLLHTHTLLRRLLHHLHLALQPPSPLLPRSLIAIRALALSAPAHRHLLASLGLIRLLLPALTTHITHPTLAPLLTSAARAALDGPGGALARAHFAAARPARSLLAAWRSLPSPKPARVVADLAHCFAACAPALPPSAADALTTPSALALLREALERAVFDDDKGLAVAALRMGAAVVAASGEPGREGGRRSLVQIRVREIKLMDAALACLAIFPHALDITGVSVKFLKEAVQAHVQNVVELGTARETQGLQLLLSCCEREEVEANRESNATVELRCALVELFTELSRVKSNFETLMSLGLTSRLLRMLPHVAGSQTHAHVALSLLERCVRAKAAQAARVDAAAILSAMAVSRVAPKAQTAGIGVLIALLERSDDAREDACRMGAVQEVHYALTEHSRDAGVVAQACRFLLRLSPLNMVSNGLVLSELRKVVRSRHRAHKDNEDVVASLDELAQALDLVSNRTTRVLTDFVALGEEERGSAVSSGSAHKRMLSSRAPVSTSFRVSFHRKAKKGGGTGGPKADSRPRRRVRSDFTAEKTFDHGSTDDIAQPANDITQSFRLRSSRLRERSWLDSLASVWVGDSPDPPKATDKKPDDRVAFEPLFETLARSRDQRPNLDEGSSSRSSSHSAAARLPPTKERLPNEMRLTLPTIRTNKPPPLRVVQRKMRPVEAGTPWQNGRTNSDEQPVVIQTLIEKTKGPIVGGRRISDSIPIGRLSFDAVDSNSGMSEADVGEEESLFSFSDSDVDSLEEGTWGTDEGYHAIYPAGNKDDDVIGRGLKDVDDGSSDEYEGSTISPQPPKEMDSSQAGRGNDVTSLQLPEIVDAREVFEIDEQFPELNEGNTFSGKLRHVISQVPEDDDEELIPQSQIYGERERVRGDGNRGSGNWGPPKESIWPLIPIDQGGDSLALSSRAAPNPPLPTRGESGSLTPRR